MEQTSAPDLSPSRLLNNIRDAVIATDCDLVITAWNDAAETMYGWRHEEVLGRSISDIMRIEISRTQVADLLQALNTAGHQRFEHWHQRRDGKRLYVSSALFALKDDNNQICSYVGVHRDITEERKATLTVEQNERRFRALIEHSYDAISLLDVEGNVLETTPAIEAILGYTPEEFKHLNVFDLIHPEDLGAMRGVQENLLAQNGFTSHVLLRAKHKNSSWRWLESVVTNLLAEPAVSAIVANFRDITRRKQAEESAKLSAERLRILLDMDQAILAARSPEAIASAALSRLMRLTPCRRASVVLGDEQASAATILAVMDTKLGTHSSLPSGAQVLPLPASSALHQGEIQFVPDINTAPESAALRALKADGIQAFARVPLIAHGILIGTLNLGSEAGDVPGTETREIWMEVAGRLAVAISQAHLHHQVQEGRQQLQALSRRLIDAQEAERRHLARELHDEVGQALTAVRLSLQAAQTRNAAPDSTFFDDCMSVIEDALSHVRNLSLDLRPSLLDDLGLSAALRWYVDRQAKCSGLRLHFTAHGFSDATNSNDQSRLPPEIETACFRVAQEALTNILRHAAAQSAEIRLHRHQHALELEVHDDGCGFDYAAAHQRATHGASLGLLGMEERVRLVGGDFSLISEPGSGTRVRALFPLDSTPLERRNTSRATKLNDFAVPSSSQNLSG